MPALFPRRWLSRLPFSGMWRHVVWKIRTGISKGIWCLHYQIAISITLHDIIAHSVICIKTSIQNVLKYSRCWYFWNELVFGSEVYQETLPFLLMKMSVNKATGSGAVFKDRDVSQREHPCLPGLRVTHNGVKFVSTGARSCHCRPCYKMKYILMA
jgi:hypothetical protein